MKNITFSSYCHICVNLYKIVHVLLVDVVVVTVSVDVTVVVVLMTDGGEDGGKTGSSFNALLIVFSKGNFSPHIPRKSSVSILQTIAPPSFMLFRNTIFSLIDLKLFLF